MASRETESNISQIGRIIALGAVLSVASGVSECKKPNVRQNVEPVAKGQVLTEAEIAELRRIENFFAVSSEPKPIPTPTASPQVRMFSVENSGKTREIVPELTAEHAAQIEKYRAELPSVLLKINAEPQQAEDLTMYYPIYRAAQDRFGVPWDLIWIVHQAESTVSRNPAAFTNKVNYGAMGRALADSTDEDVARANRGYEDLRQLLVRHFDDKDEIFWGTAALSEWAGQDRDFHKALLRYSSRETAEMRFRRFLALEGVLVN